jgi:hypothetical protein
MNLKDRKKHSKSTLPKRIARAAVCRWSGGKIGNGTEPRGNIVRKDAAETATPAAILSSPINFSFLRRVDLCYLDTFVIEKDLHIVEQELVRIGI